MVIHVSVANNCPINICIVDYSAVYVYHCRVVPEMAAIPSAATVAIATVTESIINTSVKAYTGTPVACMEAIMAAIIAPVGWRP